MPIGSLRRSIGALGLVALVPVAAMLLTGALTPVDAARRAVLSVVVVLALGRVVAWGIRATATLIERTAPGAGEDDEPVAPAPERSTAAA